MRILALILVTVAVLALVGLVRTTLLHVDRSPETILEDARHYLAQPEPDFDRTLADLNLALAAAQDAGKSDLTAEILLQRGDVYRLMRSFPKAREDFLRVLDEYRPDDPKILLSVLSLDLYSREYERGLESANELIEKMPDLSAAWSYRGRFLVRLGEQRLAEIEDLIGAGLADEEAAVADERARRLMGMDLTDPRRIARQHELRGMFKEQDEAVARQVMRLIDQASGNMAQAREAFAESFRGGVNRDAVHEYLTILREAGYDQEAIDFGMIVSNFQDIASYPATMQLLMEALTDVGRATTACNLIEERFSKRVLPNADFLESWCYSLMKAERWTQLVSTAAKLRQNGSARQGALAEFYTGLAYAKRDNPRQASIAFHEYRMREDHPDPLGNSEAFIWRTLARRNELVGQSSEELEDLIGAVQADPNADGTAWLRMAQVLQELDPENLYSIERAYTHAIRLLPDSAAELIPRWRRIGQERLGRSGTSMQLLMDSLERRGLCAPAVTVGPYELFRLMELYQESDRLACVVSVAERLLRDYPGFLVVLDADIDASLELGNWSEAAGRLLERLRAGGYDPDTAAKFDLLPAGTLTPDQEIELMTLDPTHAGRLRIARALREAGSARRALDALVTIDPDELGDPGRLLAGELMIEAGTPADAIGMLNGIAPDSESYLEALHLKLIASALSAKAGVFRALLHELSLQNEVDAKRLLGLLDDLWLGHQLENARRLLTMLDERADTRSPRVMLALGQTALLSDDARTALESFDRAEAFDAGVDPALGRLLAAVENREWTYLAAYARELEQAGRITDPLSQAVLVALDERLDEAGELVQKGLEAQPEEPLWRLLSAAIGAMRIEVIQPDPELGAGNEEQLSALLYGQPAGSRDPRETLGLVLALRTKGWESWSAARWQTVARDPRVALWADYLAARGLEAAGRLEEADELAATVTRHWDQFGPGWDLREHLGLARFGRWDHVELVRLRQARRQALGDRPGEEAEIALVRAWSLERQGDLDGALEMAQKAVSLDRDLLPARQKLAQLLEARGSLREALANYREITLSVPPEVAGEVVGDYLDFLERAHERDPVLVPRATIAAELEILGRHMPRDPRVALARAREELRAENVYSAVRVRRAYDQLDAFRDATGRVPIDSLQPHSSRDWMEFYLELDPKKAEEFVRAERRARPGDLDLWVMLGETLVAEERYEEAISHYETVLSILPDAQTRQQLVALLARYGSDLQRVEHHVAMMRRLEGGTLDPVTSFWRARALINVPGETREEGIEVLGQLWDQANAPDWDAEVSRAEIGRLYGIALSLRGTTADRVRAQKILESVIPELTDPIQRNLAVATGNLALHSKRE